MTRTCPLSSGEIVDKDIWANQGEKVEAFNMANKAIGTLVLKFQTAEDLEYAITHQHEWLKIVLL